MKFLPYQSQHLLPPIWSEEDFNEFQVKSAFYYKIHFQVNCTDSAGGEFPQFLMTYTQHSNYNLCMIYIL